MSTAALITFTPLDVTSARCPALAVRPAAGNRQQRPRP